MKVLDLLFPKFCLGCGKWGSYICSDCFSDIHPFLPLTCPICSRTSSDGVTHPRCKKQFGLDRLISFFPYTGIVQKAIKTVKYRYAHAVANDLLRYVPDLKLPKRSIAIPIPLHPSRSRQRGFNQAEILARALLKSVSVSIRTDVLKRVRKTVPQVDMKNREERLVNMKGVFVANTEALATVRHHIVVLVDDVYTTGATMQSACEALKRAGVKTVWGLTIAQ